MTEAAGRIRRCVGCGAERPKHEMLRVVRRPDGEVSADAEGRAPGRGAYICRDPECVRKAVKRKALPRALKTPVVGDIYAEIESLCGSAAG